MSDTVYVCAKLSRINNIYGSKTCTEWVEYVPDVTANPVQYVVSSLSLTFEQYLIVTQQLISIFTVFIVFAVLSKAIKML